MKHLLRLKLSLIIFLSGLLITNLSAMSKAGSPSSSGSSSKLSTIASWFSKKNSDLKSLGADQSTRPLASESKSSSEAAALSRREKATREEKERMSDQDRQKYREERTSTKAADRAAMSEDARKLYDEERAARKAAKVEAGKKTSEEQTAPSITSPVLSSNSPTSAKPIKVAGQEYTQEEWDAKTLREKKESSYRKLQKGSPEYLAGKEEYLASLSEKEKREHLQHSEDRQRSLIGKVGGATTGGLSVGTIGLLGIAATTAGVKALGDDGKASNSSGTPQIQIFESGSQPSSSGIESEAFTPSSGPAGETFESVAPVD